MKKLTLSILLIATVLATHAFAQGGYPLGSDVASTITTSKFNIVGASSTLVATDNADRVFCKIVQRGTNAIDVGYSLTVTNGQQDYLAAPSAARGTRSVPRSTREPSREFSTALGEPDVCRHRHRRQPPKFLTTRVTHEKPNG